MSIPHSLPLNRLRHGSGDPFPPISSLIQPPIMDPAAVDFRAFYPYTPNEVKHRKRTTSAQLKILEGIFKRDTKPNAALRNELAAQLEMTARGVQVWFQNRRAKEKTKAAKGKKPEQESGKSTEGSPGSQQDQKDDSAEPSSQDSSPTRVHPPQLHVVTDAANASWQSSPAVTPDDNQGPLGAFSDHHFLRRGSLPAGELFPADSAICPPLIGHLDPFSRRRSVDASLHKLASNPYAHLARAKNGLAHGSRISRPRLPYHRPSYVPELQHTGPMPYGPGHARHSSMDSKPFRFPSTGVANSSSPSPLAHFNSRASLPDSNLFSFPSRSMGSLIPGPLPSPDFTFGAPSTNSSLTSPCSADSDRSSPEPFRDFGAYDFEKGGESLLASAYDNYPRFGSLASTTTESSYYSDNVICKTEDDQVDLARRDSCSGFANMIANLDVNGYESPYTNGAYSSPEEISRDSDSTGPYPSPTVSGTVPDMVPFSTSSELAYALQSPPQKTVVKTNSYTGRVSPVEETSIDNSTNIDSQTFFTYTHSNPTLPTFESNEQQIEPYNVFATPTEIFPVDNSSSNHQSLDSNISFSNPQDVYSSYSIEAPTASYPMPYA